MLGKLNVQIGANITGLTGGINKARYQLKSFSQDLNGLGRKLSVSVTAPLTLLGGRAIKTAAEFEDLRTSFEVLTGSAEEGAKVFERLRAFAASTPFETAQLAKATKTMLSFGFTTDDSADTLRMLGDVAMGNGQKLDTLTLAFSRIVSNGKAMGQEINMMIDQGFNPLQIISEKTGKSMSVLKDEMAKGAISADMIRDAFKTATSEGGQFFGGMEKGSQTLSGVFSTFRDNVTGALAVMGEELVKTFDLKNLVKDATIKIQALTTAFSNMSDEVKKKILVIATVIGAGGPLLIALSTLTKAMSLINLKILLVVAVLSLVGITAQSIADNFLALRDRADFAFNGMKFMVTDFLLSFLNMEHLMRIAGNTLGNVFMTTMGGVAVGLAGARNELERMRSEALAAGMDIENRGMQGFVSFGDSVNNLKTNMQSLVKDGLNALMQPIFDLIDGAEQTTEAVDETAESMDNAVESSNKFGDVLEGLKMKLGSLSATIIESSLDAFTQSLFNAGKYNTQELELRKINLQKQKDALNQSLAEQEISQKEYGLRIALLNQELLDTETQINEARKNSFQKSLDLMLSAAKQAVKEILAQFAKLLIIKGLLSILGAPTGQFGKGLVEGLKGMMKARGGPVFSNQPYIVGERGPELFTPNISGSIVPNNQLMGTGMQMAGTSNINLGGEFRIKGTDLVLTLEEANYKLGR
jgi:tape measure domain-containing protein